MESENVKKYFSLETLQKMAHTIDDTDVGERVILLGDIMALSESECVSKRNINLTVTENQLKYIMNSLEFHFRVCMGQTMDMAEELCSQNYDIKNNFGKYIELRDRVCDLLQYAVMAAFNHDWNRYQKTERVQSEIDMWCMIRHWFWKQKPKNERGIGSDDGQPFQYGEEPLPHIEKAEVIKTND